MAEFCDECNKPRAANTESASLSVYCQCRKKKEARSDGNKANKCACGCGFITRNGYGFIKGHPVQKEQALLTRTETHARLERIEAQVIEDSYISNVEVVGETEKDDLVVDSQIDYEKVLDDMMQRYSEMGIAITCIRRILRSQGKDPE